MKLETLAALRAVQLVHEIGLHQSTFEGDLGETLKCLRCTLPLSYKVVDPTSPLPCERGLTCTENI